ncbi:MAG: VWA domain-containing protein [Sulfobacillus sp.]
MPVWSLIGIPPGSGDRASRTAALKRGQRTVDWSKTIRRWSRRGQSGWPVLWRPYWKQPGKVVILWDVSGSMEPYVPLYLPWAYQWVKDRNAGVFAFGTRVVDLTENMHKPFSQVIKTLRKLDAFGAGTTIGDAILSFDTQWGNRWLSSSTTVVMISDGWDVGSPDVLGWSLARLRQRIRRMVWIHPLMATPGFQPKTRALRVALRYVDDMFAGGDGMALLRLRERLQ